MCCAPATTPASRRTVRAAGSITVDKGGKKAEKVVFNRTGGMCPRCEGMGTVSDIDLTQLYDDSKSLAEGARIAAASA